MAADVQTPRLAVSALPSMLMNYLTGPSLLEDTEQQQNQQALDSNISTRQIPERTLSSPSPSQMPADTPQSNRSRNRNSLPLMFDGTDEASTSREGSLMSATGRSRKRSSRPRTSYSINHAPPKGSARHKIHVRARPLLQLHQLSTSTRPMPAFELLPSAIFSPSLSRAISKAFKARHGLCPADLAIVKAEKYHQHEESNKEEDESRDVLALICKGKKGDSSTGAKAKLFLDDGSEWEAYPLPNGGYEFSSTDEHGLGMTVRWVLRRPRARRSQSASDMATITGDQSQQRKFNFSTISPSSRRHPIIANLNSASLDINDSYTIPTPTTISPEVSPPGSDHEAAGTVQDEAQSIAEPIQTTASLKALITATAVWVTLREGWCPGYRSEDSMPRSPSMRLSSASPTKTPAEFAAAAALPKDDMPRRSASIRTMLRTAGLKRRSTASAPVDGSLDEPSVSRSSSARMSVPVRRARAESTSTVVVHSKRPRGRRADTTSTGSSIPTGRELSNGDMTEEEVQDETKAAVATRTKHTSAPSPLIPALDADSEEEHSGSTAVPSPMPTQAFDKKHRESSTTSTNMSIEAKKAEALSQIERPRRRRFRSLFCGMSD